MHSPNMFRETRLEPMHRLIADHPLATLITADDRGIEANLLPFTLHQGGEYGVLRAHLARNNGQLEALRAGAGTLVLFQGPQAYVSPSWYPSKAVHGKVVPTWNYVMVQVRGTPRVIEDEEWIKAQLESLTDHQEAGRDQPWKTTDSPDDFIRGQLKAIVGMEIPIHQIEGKWKVSQNRSAADRAGVLDGMRAEGVCAGMVATLERT